MDKQLKLNYIVRHMKESDFEEVRQLWRLAGFGLYYYSNDVMLADDPKGFFVAQDVNSGKLLGVCSGVNLSSELAYVGQYAVHPDCRGLGVGKEIWGQMMDHIGKDRNICLHSASTMVEKYRNRSGFVVSANRSVDIYSGDFNVRQLVKNIDGISVIPISEDNIEKVCQYDTNVCGLDRTAMTRKIIKTPGTVTAVALNGDNQVVSYCVVCVSVLGPFLIEPMYANDQKIAELLITKCYERLPESKDHKLLYHLWDTHSQAVDIARKMGLKFIIKEPMLYTKKVVEGDADKAFSMANLAFFPF